MQPDRRAWVLGHVGVVVGATIGDTGADFSGLNGSILAPGLGAQGGTPEGLADVFGSARRLVLPSSSREILLRRTRSGGPAGGGPAGPRRDAAASSL